jgi:tRNA (cytidine/uridine-2'-O-)-methyltransferase
MFRTRGVMKVIENPSLHIVLYEPEIPANTGNIARLCGAAQLTLHLVHPLGFKTDDKNLKRAGLDYWEEVDVRHHLSFDAFLKTLPHGAGLHTFSTHAPTPYTRATVRQGDFLIFGPETRGLPSHIRECFPSFTIPIWGRVRSLNLSTSVGIVAYHYLHQMGRFQ